MKNNKGQLVTILVFVFIFLVLAAGVYFVVNMWINPKVVPTETITDINANVPKTPENPTALPLVQVTDPNNNIIAPPSGQDALIMPPGEEIVPPTIEPTPVVPIVTINTSNITIPINISEDNLSLNNISSNITMNDTNITVA